MSFVSIFQVPSSYGLEVYVFEDLEEKDELQTELITKVFVQRPRLHRVTESALLADSVSKSQCPDVVCLCVFAIVENPLSDGQETSGQRSCR